MKIILAMWRLFYALAFYPVLVVTFIWLYARGAHWGYGVGIIALILIFDPIWRVVGRRIFSWRPHK